MTKKQFRARLRLLIVLTLLLAVLTSYAAGKYVQNEDISAKVTFKASLASNVILQEHTAKRQTDGSYELVEPFVTENTYYLIPGLDIPKDPHIIIEGKTPIEAYLFVEVVDSIGNDAVTWEMDTTLWTRVTEITDKIVYVYKDVLPNSDMPESINIIKNQELKVSQHLNCDSRTLDSSSLTFNVILIEKVGNATADVAYKRYPTS